MKKFYIYISVMLLFATIISPQSVRANDQVNYKETPGYAESFFEHLIEYQVLASNKLENNINATYDYIQYVKQTARNYYNDTIKLHEDLKSGEKGHIDVFLSLIAGTFFTGKEIVDGIWDRVKSIFADDVENEEFDLFTSSGDLALPNGYKYVAINKSTGQVYKETTAPYLAFRFSGSGNTTTISALSHYGGTSNYFVSSSANFSTNLEKEEFNEKVNSNSTSLNYLNVFNQYTEYKIIIKSIEDDREVPQYINQSNPVINNIVNNVTNNNVLRDHYPKNYEPKMILQLTCNNENLNAVYNAATDSYFVGEQLVSFKNDGLVYLDSQPCTNFTWQAPIIEFDENTPIDEILITDGSGTTDYAKDKVQCDGILCWVSNIFSKIASLASSIADLGKTVAGLITDLIDAIFHLIVPEDLDFITGLFDGLKTTFTEKFVIATDMQNIFKSVFTASETNPLTGLSFTLPATETELSFSVFAILDDYVPMIKRIMSAVLGLMTLMYVYRKITGSGGVMEK